MTSMEWARLSLYELRYQFFSSSFPANPALKSFGAMSRTYNKGYAAPDR